MKLPQALSAGERMPLTLRPSYGCGTKDRMNWPYTTGEVSMPVQPVEQVGVTGNQVRVDSSAHLLEGVQAILILCGDLEVTQ